MKKVVIIGSGISGLATAWFLERIVGSNIKIEVFETQGHSGGWIRTICDQGFLFELGPRGFRPSGKGRTTLQLVKEIGLEKNLIPSSDSSNKRFLFTQGKLRAVNLFFLLRNGLLKGLWKDLTTSPKFEEETIHDFFLRRFTRPFLETIIDPMVLGIYGGSIKMLSLKSCFPRFDEWEKKEKSIFRGLLKNRETTGMPKLYSFKHGMEELPRSLLKSIHAEIHYHTAVKSVKKNMLETSKGSTHADCIVFATSATIVGKLLGDSYPLASLPHQTITTINMGFSSIKLKKGFGYLVPSKEKCPILGMTWDSQIFPDQASYGARICLMIAGEVSPETIQTTVQQSLIEHMHIHEKPAVCNIHTARFAIPQYLIGHASLVSKLPAPPLFFAGSAYEGVGINDCLVRAEKVARHLSHFLALA